jgi:hypothetical protein
MKNIVLAILFLSNLSGWAQSSSAEKLLKTGNVFCRIMREHNPKNANLERDTEKSAYFLKFGSEKLFKNPTQDTLMVEVFMSERYFEDTFRKRYDTLKYDKDREGFRFLAKITNQNIYIYPELLTNVCLKNMHCNRKPCNKLKNLGENADIKQFHLNSLIQLAKNISSAAAENEKMNAASFSSINCDKCQDLNLQDLFFNSEIVGFTYDYIGDSLVGIRKTFTKNAISDDHLIDNNYQLRLVNTLGVSNSKFHEEVFSNGFEETLARPSLTFQVAPSNENEGWIYAGKLKSNVTNLRNATFIDGKGNVIISSETKGTTSTAINLRKTEPHYNNGKWTMGQVIRVLDKEESFTIDSFRLVPGADGYPLLWLKIRKEL